MKQQYHKQLLCHKQIDQDAVNFKKDGKYKEPQMPYLYRKTKSEMLREKTMFHLKAKIRCNLLLPSPSTDLLTRNPQLLNLENSW